MQPLLATLLHKVFPNETITFGRNYEEVNGLSPDCVPVGVLDSFVSKFENDRIFYLIQIGDTTLLLRVCDAMKNAGYAKFAVVHETSIAKSSEAVKHAFYRWKNSLAVEQTNPTISVTITAQVTTSVQLSAGESLEDLKERYVDIYLHGSGEDGCYDKRDIGANKWTITTSTEDKPLIVGRPMFLALVNALKEITDLQNVYDDENNTPFSWAEIESVLKV